MDEIINEEIYELLIKCLEGNAISEEYEEAFQWINQSKENRKYYQSIQEIYIAAGLNRSLNNDVLQKIWKKIKLKTNPQQQIMSDRGHLRLIKIAASFILVFALGILANSIFRSTSKNNDQLFTIEAPKGAKSYVTLNDGTKVWLNAGTKIQYSNNYGIKLRDIYLSGEAYFEVAKNPRVPFRVHAGGIVVKALGTIFNVKAYPEEKSIETTLVEGRVSIHNTNKSSNNQDVILDSKQQAVYYRNFLKTPEQSNVKKEENKPKKELIKESDKIVVAENIQPEVYTSWKDKRWVFSSEQFGNFLIKLERLYDIQIILKNEELRNYKLTGSIEEDNIEMVLKALQLIIPIDYNIGHKQITIDLNTTLRKKYDKMLKKH